MSRPGALLEHYYRELVNYVSLRIGSRHLAEDIAHDAYVRILERCDAVQIEHPRAFLYRTAQNLIIDGHRRNSVRRAEPLEVLEAEEGAWVAPPLASMAHDERLALLQRALGELNAPCRQCFLLRKLNGLSHPEIAERLGLSKAMVEKHIVNAMKHCRVRMREWEQR
ncbi:sigma-70 family RNA polymerase sigma factor [Pseudomonas typographi]|uniref:Sigma-70 family RNA polymerase sigma factor n=1 Tax=Pseudomonas typographi TaxID=2715964 RepID=A0ABR7Z7T7_9PSED|nr:sigma-70 family RNA polymerase sigma factor [Pseudomonas typographi]MBD1554512.1 sigma-70 family RNA polymerase sigma factor [Pseudomonas typographi]MBD1589561.1 sigma-70 family RNA polymerase sigma factor [Pseudomonas typographi]MBD1601374.1 sigma-70 family RNA polymerase sigma factor [Pseudomonas typographi]